MVVALFHLNLQINTSRTWPWYKIAICSLFVAALAILIDIAFASPPDLANFATLLDYSSLIFLNLTSSEPLVSPIAFSALLKTNLSTALISKNILTYKQIISIYFLLSNLKQIFWIWSNMQARVGKVISGLLERSIFPLNYFCF